VGDDDHSWGVDGVRHKLWHNGGMPADVSWAEGDVVGFAVDAVDYKCHVTLNGATIVTFDITGAKGGGVFSKTHKLFPCFTSGSGCSIKVNLGEDAFCSSVHARTLLTAPPHPYPAPSLVQTMVNYLNTGVLHVFVRVRVCVYVRVFVCVYVCVLVCAHTCVCANSRAHSLTTSTQNARSKASPQPIQCQCGTHRPSRACVPH